MNNIVKNIQSSLKFVYSENNSLSVIFHDNELLMGVVGEFNKNLKELEKITGANLYSRLITGMPINDGTGGYKAWSIKLLKKIDLDTIKSQGYSFQIEMNFRAWILNAKIKECPIIFVDRTIGESKMSRSIMFEAIWVVWRLRVLKFFKRF